MIPPFLQRRFSIQLSFTFSVLQLLLILLSMVFIAYLAWELYWWNKVGLYFIKWHTHIVFTGLATALLLLPLIWIGSRANRQKRIMVAGSVWSTIVLLEFILLLTGWNKTYIETRAGYYRSPFDPEKENTYHVYHNSDSFKVEAPEFTFTINYNSLGFLGGEWPATKDSTRKRVITMGDSFTEGDGAPMDSCYPALMQKILGDSFEVLNAGVRGSDPVFGIKNMEDRLLPYQPDLVVQAVSENDVLFDFCIRGGYERFQNDSTVLFNQPPWWEPIYALSYVGRIFFHAFGMNMSKPCGNKENPALIADRNRILNDVFDRYEKLGAAHDFITVILFYPTQSETFHYTYDFDFIPAKKHIETLRYVRYADILPCYREKIKSSGAKPEDFYWKIDGHHNSRGYHLMAGCVADALLSLLSEKAKRE